MTMDNGGDRDVYADVVQVECSEIPGDSLIMEFTAYWRSIAGGGGDAGAPRPRPH
jgi:hypothetical protein